MNCFEGLPTRYTTKEHIAVFSCWMRKIPRSLCVHVVTSGSPPKICISLSKFRSAIYLPVTLLQFFYFVSLKIFLNMRQSTRDPKKWSKFWKVCISSVLLPCTLCLLASSFKSTYQKVSLHTTAKHSSRMGAFKSFPVWVRTMLTAH